MISAFLVREGVEIIIEELSDKAVSLNFLNLVKKKTRKNEKVLKRLSR